MRIAIIGAGNMGSALARGLAQSQQIEARDICVSNPSPKKTERLKKDFKDMHTTQNNCDCVNGADLVILAVKPWKVKAVIHEIRNVLNYNHVVVACMAGGINTHDISVLLDRGDNAPLPPVYCLIPNTAIAVRESMTFLTSIRANQELDETMLNLFRTVGEAMLVEERLMPACMALASCGIAYAFRYIRAATEGGVELGVAPQDAQHIVAQTLKGATTLLEINGSHPEIEIDKVTTPGGITIKGLNAMEHAGFTNSVIEGLKASKK